MSVETIARFYVTVVEPGFKVILACVAVVLLLQVVNIFLSKDSKIVFADSAFKAMVSFVRALVLLLWRFARAATKVLLKMLSVIFDTVKDFFTSKI